MSNLCRLCLDFEQNFACPRNFEKAIGGFKNFVHHQSLSALKEFMNKGCQLCKLLYNGYLHTRHARREEEDEDKSLQDIESLVDVRELYELQCYIVLSRFRNNDPYCLELVLSSDVRPYPLVENVTFALAVETDRSPFDTSHGVIRSRQCGTTADLRMAKRWIDDCECEHEKCKTAVHEYPTRLLRISDTADSIMLVRTDPLQDYQYVALSHRWGDHKPALTVESNLEDRMRGFSVQDLPATFRDAVFTANKLGYQYLWVDSLCIVQDEEKDWERECPRMSTIYQGAALTVAAPAAKDSSIGFLHKRPLHEDPSYEPCTIQYRDVQGQPVNTMKIWYPGCHRSPQSSIRLNVLGKQPESVLENRGWLLQERMLSPRILYFGSYQMYFECRTLPQYEYVHDNDIMSDQEDLRDFKPFDTWRKSRWWRHFVENYSRQALTVSTDRFPAISGIIHACRPPPGEVYLAGIWSRELPSSLLWYVQEQSEESEQEQTTYTDEKHKQESAIVSSQYDYIAPSWSWASVKHNVVFPTSHTFIGLKDVLNIVVVSCSTTLVDSSPDADPYGRVKEGHLHVQGKLCKVDTNGGSPFELSSNGAKKSSWHVFLDDIAERHGILQALGFSEIYALEIGITEGSGFALAIVPVLRTESYFRRIGLLRTYKGNPEEMMDEWFGRVQQQDLTII
ncbi:hypothetical protein NW762_005707 [Fusarium torreyae]|uniref:Heterokaryon incompatibility domain-containing protein n=1 Tax=Fusarium torreyae TaxID=1237075 RepID=A0A9W8S3Q2_9HYPO|nr:hypothetical protein NW762_005707 [Fusarium torreyae]